MTRLRMTRLRMTWTRMTWTRIIGAVAVIVLSFGFQVLSVSKS